MVEFSPLTNYSSPVARVKKIIATDDGISSCSNNAAFVLTVATEMFIQHLVDKAHDVVKSERKPRRNIQYKDVANAVARVENLEFLADVVPKTTTYKQYKQKVATGEISGVGAAQTNGHGAQSRGQRTLDPQGGLKQKEVATLQHASGPGSDVDLMDVVEDEEALQDHEEKVIQPYAGLRYVSDSTDALLST